MRKFLLLTMMCFLAFCGTLKAQDVVQVGTKTLTNAVIPTHTYYKYSYSQQIYTASEINHAPGTISEISFITNNTGLDREVSVYMINTNKDHFTAVSDWVYVGISDIVYEGFVTCNELMTVTLTKDFEYKGENILLCVQDRTGKDIGPTSFDCFVDGNNRALYKNSDGSMMTPENITILASTGTILTQKNVINLTFATEEIPVEGAPNAPTNLVAEALSQTEIALTWDAVQDAVSYNVYDEDGNVLDNVTETSYTVENLVAETEYCFKVSALNDNFESPKSLIACATTLRNPEMIVNLEEVALGDIILGDFWSENNDKSVTVSVEYIETEITNIECENEFFLLPENIDFTANPVTLEITYNEAALSVGEKTAELVITHTYGDVTIPMSANVYTPASPDVFELAEEITFVNGTFSATPDFENLHDNYNLPDEVNAGNTPDAVYTFELNVEQAVTVDVTGTNGIYAIYKAEEFENNGPKADNNYAGEKGTPSTFFYDFEEGSLEDNFTLLDKDGDGFNWYINDNGINGASLASKSWDNQPIGKLTPDNYIVTKEKYAIKSTSKLLFSYHSSWPEKFAVEISTDGTTFTNIWSDEGAFSSIKMAEISLAEYADQELYIALRHYECSDGQFIQIDNFRLENKDDDFVTYIAGKYYLVAAAENAFTVNMTIEASPDDLPAAPQNLKVTEVTATTATLTWDAVAEAVSYKVYNGSELLKENVTSTTCVIENLEAFTEYCFSVRSFDGENTSLSSAEVCVTTTDFVITAPANVAVTALDAYSVKISWDRVDNATSYNVYQNDKKIANNLTTVMFTVENLNPNTEYCFVVSAVRRDIEEKASAVCGTTSAIDFESEYLPTEFMFDFNNQSFDGLRTIDADGDGNNWIFSTEEQGYENTYAAKSYSSYGTDLNPDNYLVTKSPYRIDATSVVTLNARIGYEMDMFKGEHYAVVVSENGTDWTVVFEETLDHINWTNTSVSLEAYAGKAVLVGVRHYNCTALSYVRVDNFALTSNDEPIDPSVVPNAPANLVAEATSSSTIKLTWDAVSNATSYKVYSEIAFVAEVTETTYTVENLLEGTNYCFTVKALNEAGESVASEQACDETPKKIEAPKNLTVTVTGSTTVSLSWDPVEGAIGYGIHSNGLYIGSTSGVTTNVKQLLPNTRYCFTVMTITEMTEIDGENYITGCSDESEEVCATTEPDGVEELEAAFNIYPNPVENELFIETEMNVEEISIYDVYGRLCRTDASNASTSNAMDTFNVSVRGLNSGIYFINIKTDKGNVVKRFVKN